VGITTPVWEKVVSVSFPQRVDPRIPVFTVNFPVFVAMSLVEARFFHVESIAKNSSEAKALKGSGHKAVDSGGG
jgi:hypothetical protein